VNELNTTIKIYWTGMVEWTMEWTAFCIKKMAPLFVPFHLSELRRVSFVEGRLLATCTECIHFNLMYVTFHWPQEGVQMCANSRQS